MNDPRSGDAARMSALVSAVAKDRDQAAFRLLFDYFAPRIRAFARSRGADVSTAEDVVQETFVNVWRKAHLFDPGKASATTWIYTVARNASIDLGRKMSRPEAEMDDPAFAANPVRTPQQEVLLAEEATRLERALALLPAEQREVLRLAFFAEQSHQDIADALGLPLGTVKSRIRLALGRIRQELGEDA